MNELRQIIEREPWPRLGGRRVLVVDEHPVVGAVIVEALLALGHRAIACRTADEALGYCERFWFDLVLTEADRRTRTGELLPVALRRHRPELPVAVLTAWFDHPALRSPALPARLVLRKPFRLEDLELAVRLLAAGGQRCWLGQN